MITLTIFTLGAGFYCAYKGAVMAVDGIIDELTGKSKQVEVVKLSDWYK